VFRWGYETGLGMENFRFLQKKILVHIPDHFHDVHPGAGCAVLREEDPGGVAGDVEEGRPEGEGEARENVGCLELDGLQPSSEQDQPEATVVAVGCVQGDQQGDAQGGVLCVLHRVGLVEV
jgi:hypothetical protein